jgi:hypothetical protein
MISWGVLFFSFLLSPFSFLFLGGRFFSLFSSFVSCHFLASEVFGCFERLSIFVIPNNFHRVCYFYLINSQAPSVLIDCQVSTRYSRLSL